ncbi:unnamed protein product [Fraxinus pennsylvanica]|uniref:ditrans,polycis-polyprenyl diphosphate synthase [(2E,6E)-farnesyldiphosphate specific] n=1 Tax=Fraxinus pennsylvanica TaxID=56036 RepID=A0AAD1ZLC7_9LAMI|nr:unnamed protein product [Fraxinus pennsylvanica]
MLQSVLCTVVSPECHYGQQLAQNRANFVQETNAIGPLFRQKYMNAELISFSDGKETVAKAANFLFEKHYSSSKAEKLNLIESDMAKALTYIGCRGTEPDLLVIYRPTRCQLGFPAWRMSHTEIV